MLFNSVDFMLFFPFVTGIYFVIPRKARLFWLLVTSYWFYMSWYPKYAVLIGFSTVVTYFSALLFSHFERNGSHVIKRVILIACICANLGVLGLFKYASFCVGTVNWILSRLHLSLIRQRFSFMLPVGISFYTFQALGYMIDVYRGDVEAEKNFFRYAVFVSFFPQLVAGPIERSRNLLSQIKNIEKINLWNSRRITSGAILMIWGLFMKMVLADRVSILVDTVFNSFRMYGSTELVIAALGFSLQIYCDFGSYSMIAIGTARILGFTLMENFCAPYFSRSIREFWSRWHISLSTWFRDYLYIPLGGNRKGKRRKAINTMIVFLVSGLWHGANWSFVAWGGIHGFYQVIEDGVKPYGEKVIRKLNVNTACFSWRLLQTAITFTLVSFAWIFFRANSITDALCYVQRIFTRPTPWVLFNGEIYNIGLDRTEMNILIISVVFLLLADLIRIKKGLTLDMFLFEQNIWFEWAVILCLILMIVTFGEYGTTFDAKQFIYFQF